MPAPSAPQGVPSAKPQSPAGLTTTASSPTQLGGFTSLPVAVDEASPANVQTVVPGVLSVDVAVLELCNELRLGGVAARYSPLAQTVAEKHVSFTDLLEELLVAE